MDSPSRHGSVGHYTYGLECGWGRRKSRAIITGTQSDTSATIAPSPCKMFPAVVCVDGKTVFLSSERDTATSRLSLRLRMSRGREGRGVIVVLVYEVLHRLHSRYCRHAEFSGNRGLQPTKRIASSTRNAVPSFHVPGHAVGVLGCCLPGQSNERFMFEIASLVARNYDDAIGRCAWKVTPDLYTLWSVTSAVTVELFADALNESGVLKSYCSLTEGDEAFGSEGTWEEREQHVVGGAANPPFQEQENICAAFEAGVLRPYPYCRCAILPISRRGTRVTSITDSISSSGYMLVSFPQATVPFRSQSSLLSTQRVHPSPGLYQSVGLFIWVNRPYLELHPPPLDIEAAYLRWATKATDFPSGSRLYLAAFKAAFPVSLRSTARVASLFENC